MDYKISYLHPSKQYLTIEAQIKTTGLKSIELFFPAWRPGRYELGNFAKNVKGFSISNQQGHAVNFQKTSKNSWLVDCASTDLLKISYFYYANELNAGSSFIDDLQLYVNPINCLVYDKNQVDEPCTLTLDIPADFQLACAAPHKKNVISCETYHRLVDSPFIASANLQHQTYSIFGIKFHLWFQGKVTVDWDKIIPDFQKFTKSQIEKFSDRRKKILGFPAKEYHFFYQIMPMKAYHGVEHLDSTVIMLGPSELVFTDSYDDFLGISSHELYHAWNIKSIRPAEMYPYDYSKENYSQLGYVAEGVTTYLGDLFLAESKVKTFEWYKLELEKLLQKHFDNFGRFNYSVAESSWDTWLDGYSKGTPGRKVSIYNEGALLAFATDMIIRRGSLNKASIHSVMNYLYVNFAQKNKGYTQADYFDACEKFSGVNFDSFIKNYVHGTNPYESMLVTALETIGFYIQTEDNPIHSERVLGIKISEILDEYFVQDLFPGSSGELAQLSTGDQLIAINGDPITKNISEVFEKHIETDITLKIKRMGRELELICPNTNRNTYPIYKIEKEKIPSQLYKSIFKSWIGLRWDKCLVQTT